MNYGSEVIAQCPNIDNFYLKKILIELFGIAEAKITPLDGYDDLNFKIECCKFTDEELNNYGRRLLLKFPENVFILKFTNPIEAEFYPDLLIAQNSLTTLLNENGIISPQIIENIYRKKYNFVKINANSTEAPVRLSNFIQGKTIEDYGKFSNNLVNLVGQVLAKFHNICDKAKDLNIESSIFGKYSPLISLEKWSFIREEFKIQKSNEHYNYTQEKCIIFEKVFDEFDLQVQSRKSEFERGLIHSDFNESNILLQNGSSSDEIIFAGLLDFGDAHYSYRIADIANAIVYFYLLARVDIQIQTNQDFYKNIAKEFLKGYKKYRKLVIEDFDFQFLGLFMKARLISSIVYGLRTVRINIRQKTIINESKDYVLKTQEMGWKTLQELDRMDLNMAFPSSLIN